MCQIKRKINRKFQTISVYGIEFFSPEKTRQGSSADLGLKSRINVVTDVVRAFRNDIDISRYCNIAKYFFLNTV